MVWIEQRKPDGVQSCLESFGFIVSIHQDCFANKSYRLYILGGGQVMHSHRSHVYLHVSECNELDDNNVLARDREPNVLAIDVVIDSIYLSHHMLADSVT